MAPKRKERESDAPPKNGRIDNLQTDHELFLQAFEKPTQIYRYLRTRNMISPIFLNRTLSYMKSRMSRNNTKRSTFKVDSMLNQKMTKTKSNVSFLNDYMTLMFLGFYDKSINESMASCVRVEIGLLKISHKKRKEGSSPFMEVNCGVTDVEINPNDDGFDRKLPAVSISNESFKPVGAPMNRSYILVLRVHTYSNYILSNGTDEPAAKKTKETSKEYGSELVIFDKYGRCLLTEGEYVLALEEMIKTPNSLSPKKPTSWETIPAATLEDLDKSYNPFNAFDTSPALKFRLIWTKEAKSGLCDSLLPVLKLEETQSNKENQPDVLTNHNNNKISNNGQNKDTVAENKDKMITGDEISIGDDKTLIIYHFIYNNNSRQQTEACGNYHCPWCSLNCMNLYPLLKHLKLCHSRFTFTWSEIPNGARIDVAINELYDGSYTGSPHDLIGQSGFAFSRPGPVRRTTVTNLLVCRPRRPKPVLTEFVEIDETELNNQRPFITGHNRLYHHTVTCLPVHPKELDIDSEGEHDPQWLQFKTMMMIDEFTDVNEGEKELMKMWNLHIMKYGYVGDCQIALACDMFLEKNGRELLQKNLYRNFLLHLSSLYDYGLISPDSIYKTVQKLQRILSEFSEAKKLMTEAREQQMDFWLKVGILKQIQNQHNQTDNTLIKSNDTRIIKKEILNSKSNDKIKKPAVPLSPSAKKSSRAPEPNKLNMVRRKSNVPQNNKTKTVMAAPAVPECGRKKLMDNKDTSTQRRRSQGPVTQLSERSMIGVKRRSSVAVTTTTNLKKK